MASRQTNNKRESSSRPYCVKLLNVVGLLNVSKFVVVLSDAVWKLFVDKGHKKEVYNSHLIQYAVYKCWNIQVWINL
ncbi:unnamed protein product [Allacma fusca]|uniref:Uncharacterized protein n=1 Tax=Allacma fusca TaxID=39272 RepID=A0A8J2PI50_9HEXA|nr:unnamed protein product [Allacma fusca]